PWIALWLAATFGSYGVIKKRLDLGPVVSVTAEVLLLAPLTLAWIVFMGTGAMGSDWWTSSLLILSGPITALPLILFAYAARRAKL
ncbi:MAG: EamA family transporter RarD, partial [Marivivens sp.]|nr:EamA family transporter RarD [Marivivens sp.]